MMVAVLVPIGAAGEAQKLGNPLSTDLEVTAIEEILAEPDAWVGKRVQIAGKVSGVCAHQGCWIDLTSSTDATLRVKVDDGVIVFPQDAVGRQAVTEGEVEILCMTREQYEAWLRHGAEEEDRELAPAEVGEGPYRIVRLCGLGSEIQMP